MYLCITFNKSFFPPLPRSDRGRENPILGRVTSPDPDRTLVRTEMGGKVTVSKDQIFYVYHCGRNSQCDPASSISIFLDGVVGSWVVGVKDHTRGFS